jgi:RHS repeat-associated protein
MLAAKKAGQQWDTTAPMPLHVVTSQTERDNLEIVGRPSGATVVQYTYRDPVYDGRQREFRGFRSAQAINWGDANSPASITASQFLLGECVDDEPPPAGLASVCSSAGRWADNPREALKGLPATEDALDATDNPTYLSTTHHTYTLRRLYTGRDGREVRVSIESQKDTWSYDTAPFSKSESSPGLPDVLLDSPVALAPTSFIVPTVVRAASGTAHLRTTTSNDAFGNATGTVDMGCMDGAACLAADVPVRKTTVFAVVPGDLSGWLWRPIESYTDGLAPSEKRAHIFTSYDSNGRMTSTQADLHGTLLLDRFHASAAAKIASNSAPNASTDQLFTVGQWVFDPFGNIAAQSGPNGRCRMLDYATDYSDLVIREHLFAGAPGGGPCGALTASRGKQDLYAQASFDRGFGAITSVVDLHGERSQVDYDDFGRLVQLTKPSATQVGALAAAPSLVVDYDLARSGRPYSIVHTKTQTGLLESDRIYRESFAYADGRAKMIVTIEQADPATDLHQWIVNGLTEYDAKATPERVYLAWFWDGDPRAYPLAQTPTSPYTRQRYDAFGRQVHSIGLDGAILVQSQYHALSVDTWDAADLQPGPHQGTYASEAKDGHGRVVSVTERVHVGAAIEAHATQTDFLPTGEPYRIRRTRNKGDDVVRWLRYDSLGRMVLNVEPNTTRGFVADTSADPGSFKAWRYAYDDNGSLVGVSDPRGCGSDYYYDMGGRIVAEDYSPCLSTHATYSTPNPITGDGVEVFYQYDVLPTALPGEGTTTVAGPAGDVSKPTFDQCVVDPALQTGRLVLVSDRASRTLTAVDGRGRVSCVAKQIATPVSALDASATTYAPRWYSRTLAYDAGDRATMTTTGAKALVDPTSGVSAVHTDYTLRGTVQRVASSYGKKDSTGWADLVSSVTHDADGLVQGLVYGDAAHTTTALTYDQHRRLSSVQTYRGPPASWTQQPAAYAPAPQYGGSSPPTSFQLLLEDADFAYDDVGNPTEIRDWRNPSEWPAGAAPVTRKIQYDDLYRVSRVDYAFPAGLDTWVDPFAAEDQGTPSEQDSRRAKPSPHLSFDRRSLWETYVYDWLGNTTKTDDDAKGFYDRSLGTITNATSGGKPYQLKSAAGGAAPRDGALTTAYDDAGNLVGLSIVRNAGAPCLPATSPCSQRFAYDWDEVGRLVRARRWDGATQGAASSNLPTAATNVDLSYAYDAEDNRVRKTAVDSQGHSLHTIYAFESLDLRGTTFDGTDYADTTATEVPYLFSHGVRVARVHYAAVDVPNASSGQIHVLLELEDYLGSTSTVLDRDTSELVERSTYLSSGAADSDYRPARWDSFREDYRFTGKEEDVEVGLAYFGKRFYAPGLGRWISPDPLALHGLGADANLYSYVKGRLLYVTDLTGLAGDGPPHVSKWDVFVQTVGDVADMAEKVPGFMYDGAKESVVGTAKGVIQVADKTAELATRTVAAVQDGDSDALKQIGHETLEGLKEAGVNTVKGTVQSVKDYGKAMYEGDVEKISKASGAILVQAAGAKLGEATKALSGASEAATVERGAIAKTAVAAEEAEAEVCTVGTCGGPEECFVAGTLVATASGLEPIESITLGDRVIASTDDDGAETEVVPSLWRAVDLWMPNPEAPDDVLHVRLLRSQRWVEESGANVGAWMTLRLDEMQLVGAARVVAVGAAPPLAPPPGRVVTGTINHLSPDVRAIALEGFDERIETTAEHPFFSVDRRDWVRANELGAGDSLLGREGAVVVESVTPESGVQRVYNLEVETRHTYLVSDLWILTHNACGAPVKAYETGTYKELKKRSVSGDGLDIDHQPSHASNVARAEAKLGRKLTDAEASALRDNGTAVAVPSEWHKGKSPTYGGRNTKAQIAGDAANPRAAASRDASAMVKGASAADRGAAKAAAATIKKEAKKL